MKLFDSSTSPDRLHALFSTVVSLPFLRFVSGGGRKSWYRALMRPVVDAHLTKFLSVSGCRESAPDVDRSNFSSHNSTASVLIKQHQTKLHSISFLPQLFPLRPPSVQISLGLPCVFSQSLRFFDCALCNQHPHSAKACKLSEHTVLSLSFACRFVSCSMLHALNPRVSQTSPLSALFCVFRPPVQQTKMAYTHLNSIPEHPVLFFESSLGSFQEKTRAPLSSGLFVFVLTQMLCSTVSAQSKLKYFFSLKRFYGSPQPAQFAAGHQFAKTRIIHSINHLIRKVFERATQQLDP